MVRNIPLVLTVFVFLLVLGMMVFPVGMVSIGGERVYAEEGIASQSMASPDASIAFSISNNGNVLADGDTVSTEVTSGVVNYISNNIAIITKDINKFYVTVQAASDGTSELVGTEHKATIAPVGSNVSPNNFGDNTWGYALTSRSASDSSLDYNSLPTYSAATTPQYTSDSNVADGTYNLKLTFAAKINGDKPADHYTTKAMVSVAADAKEIASPTDPVYNWSELQYMQQMTPEACNSATENQSKSLIDNRDTSKSYTVTKLKGSAGCWMTENMDYDGGLRYYHHDTYGGYYTWANAKTVCDFTGWELPSQAQYNTLLSAYSISNNSAGSTTLRGAPLNFLYGGYYNGSLGSIDSYGNYWSSTPSGSVAYGLLFLSSVAQIGTLNPSWGYSVRCVSK